MHAKIAATATIDTSYNGVYVEEYEIAIHSLRQAIKVLPQPSYVTSLCKSAIVSAARLPPAPQVTGRVSTTEVRNRLEASLDLAPRNG